MARLSCLLILLMLLVTTGARAMTTDNNQTSPVEGAGHLVEELPMYSAKPFLELVKKYQGADGKIDYQTWKDSETDVAALDHQVGVLARVSPANVPEQFALPAAVRSYWINTYNTLVLQAVLEYWPLESVREVKISVSSRLVPGKGFFYDRKVVVGGEETNLYKLEKQVLKSQKDPRLHFAFNCASGSCPVLRSWEWTDEQLDQAARDFVNNPDNLKVTTDTVYMSRIFKWYKKDFPADTFRFLQRFAQADLKNHLQTAIDSDYPTKYFEYDWGINNSPNTPGANDVKH